MFEATERPNAALLKLAAHVVGGSGNTGTPDKMSGLCLGVQFVEQGNVADEAAGMVAMINLFDLYGESQTRNGCSFDLHESAFTSVFTTLYFYHDMGIEPRG
ncbi:hypothetical protein ACQZ6F_18985 [Rhizobium sp. A22-96]